MDSLAGEIAYRHSDGFHPKRPVTIVTASVDRIEMHQPIIPYFDLKLVGRVTHTGKSSIEVRIDIFTHKDGEWTEVMAAIFAMVARDRFTHKAAEVHKIVPETEEEIKKLQKLRDSIKGWISGKEVQDKDGLVERRRDIETVFN